MYKGRVFNASWSSSECAAAVQQGGRGLPVKSCQAGSEACRGMELSGRVLLEKQSSRVGTKLFCRITESCNLFDCGCFHFVGFVFFGVEVAVFVLQLQL